MPVDQVAVSDRPLFVQSSKAFHARFGPDGDQVGVTEDERRRRQATAVEGTKQYYDFATDAYEFGWVGKRFHYCPFAPGQTIVSAMEFYEHKLAYLMGLKAGMKVLDVGCGIGGPAREIAKFIGCEVVGITISQHQVDRATILTAEMGQSHQCVFMQGDFMNLPFPSASFDAAYAIEATVHAPSLHDVFSGIARVLKPGAVFGVSEWVMTQPAYDPTNAEHVGIRNRIERGNAVSNMQTTDQARRALVSAGFDLYHDEDFAPYFANLGYHAHRPTIPGFPNVPHLHPQVAELVAGTSPPQFRPWWYPLVGKVSSCIRGSWSDFIITFMMTQFMRKVFYVFVWILEHSQIYPEGGLAQRKTLAYCVDGAAEGGQQNIFSPCWWFIGTKGAGQTRHKGKESDKDEDDQIGRPDVKSGIAPGGEDTHASNMVAKET